MKPSYVTRKTCRLCDSTELELVMELAPTPAGDKFIEKSRTGAEQPLFPLNLSLCRGCGLVHLRDIVDPSLLYGDYLYETSISLNLPEHFQAYADSVLKKINPKRGSLVIDIGSNDGTLLRAFQKRGMKALGVEPAEELARKVTASGVPTLAKFLSTPLAKDIRKEYGAATIVTANNVMANIDDLKDVASAIKALLAADGVFVLESGYLVDTINNGVVDNVYHEHISYFSVKPLAKFFASQGLELFDVERVDTKGGSIRCMIQLAGGPRKTDPSVATCLALEASQGFDRPEVFKRFAARMEAAKKRVIEEVAAVKKRGGIVAGYGASVGVTTLVYYYGIGSSIDFFIDDNKIKQGLYSPGLHIPVLSWDAIYEKKPDTIVLFPWRYADVIMKKHTRFQEAGGHYIIPLPDCRVI